MKQHYKLKDICEIGGGQSKYNLKYASKNPGIYPVYGASKTNTPKNYINSFKYNGTYIYFVGWSSKSIVGNFFYLKNKKFSLGAETKILINFKFKINLKYLYLFLTIVNIYKYIVISGSMFQLRNDEAYDIDVFLPSLNTQNYFVKRLWFLKESFSELKKLKTQLQDIKRKLLRYCFGKFLNQEKDLCCKLKKFCNAQGGRGDLSEKFCKSICGNYPVYSSKTKGNPIFAYINKYDYNGNFIMFSRYGKYLANFCYLNNQKFSLYLSAAVICLKNKNNNLNLKYLYFFLLFDQINIRHLLSVGAAIKRINVEDILDYNIQIPSLPIQSKIIQFLSSYEFIDPVILKIDNFLNSYNSYKKTLLQILFSLIN